MALDLNQTGVDNDPKFEAMLINLQANILKGHGRNFAHHLFFKFNTSKIEEAKNWISAFASDATNGITSARKQLDDTALLHNKQIKDGGTVFTLSLTSVGYNALGIGSLKPKNLAFEQGLTKRIAEFNDNLNEWEGPFKSSESPETPVHMLIIVADTKSQNANISAERIIKQVSAFATLLLDQKGNALKMNGQGIEHFGYVDGISQPLYFKDEIDAQKNNGQWKDEALLKILLVQDPGTDEVDCFGSFLVFRKLEQNVKLFKDIEDKDKGKLPVIKDATGKDNDEMAGAMIVGRFENGFPVIADITGSSGTVPHSLVVNNDFDYSDDKPLADGIPAMKCPFHSHIRLMNPRNGDFKAGDLREKRITRRGIPYDEIGRIPEDRITCITEEMLEETKPEDGVGLLFMCYQSAIDGQFEILQKFWANAGNISGHFVDGDDSLISQGADHSKTLPLQWGGLKQTERFSFDKVVTMRGGEYFFTPSISLLKKIGSSKEVQ